MTNLEFSKEFSIELEVLQSQAKIEFEKLNVKKMKFNMKIRRLILESKIQRKLQFLKHLLNWQLKSV
jgi:hypothetical protein